MRRALALTAAALAGLGHGIAAQAPRSGTDLSVEVDLADFGVATPADVRFGQLVVIHEPGGPRLDVRHLLASPPGVEAATDAEEVPVPEPAPDGRPGDGERPLRALWVWNTRAILSDVAERETFLDFVARQRIDRVYLYLPAAPGRSAARGHIPFDGHELGPLLRELRVRGALTYALDGDPEYARPENHDGIVRTVRELAAYNRSAPPEERYLGIRYDIEPYLARGFQGPARAALLDGYTRVVADAAAAAREGGLAFGVDIPFWFDERDEVTGARFEAELDGRRAPVLDHLLEHVDDLTIMAYRTEAEGPNGVVRHAWREVSGGGAHGVGVFVGLETTRILDETLYSFRGEGRSGVPPLDDAPWVVAIPTGETRARLLLVEGRDALDRVAGLVEGRDDARYWFAGAPRPVPGSTISFETLGAQALEDVADAVLARLGGAAAFRGLAFHDYLGLRALTGGGSGSR